MSTAVLDHQAPVATCPCAGVFVDLVARLEAVRFPGRWGRRRVSSYRTCPECAQKWTLTLHRTTRPTNAACAVPGGEPPDAEPLPEVAMTKRPAGSVTWTGKNLADVKRLHPDVAHYPVAAGEEALYRDWSQHPDNLHVHTPEGHTLIAAPGDTITKDADGRITVAPTGKQRPTATGKIGPGPVHAVTASDAMKGKGGAK